MKLSCDPLYCLLFKVFVKMQLQNIFGPRCIELTAELLYRLVDFHVDCDPPKTWLSYNMAKPLFVPSVTYFIDLALQEQRQYFLKRINEWTLLDYWLRKSVICFYQNLHTFSKNRVCFWNRVFKIFQLRQNHLQSPSPSRNPRIIELHALAIINRRTMVKFALRVLHISC